MTPAAARAERTALVAGAAHGIVGGAMLLCSDAGSSIDGAPPAVDGGLGL